MTGRIALLYMDWGDGWRCLTHHGNDQAGLDGLEIDWGSEQSWEQPDPPVMSFTLRDLTGSLAGDALWLAGSRVWLQRADAVTWGGFHAPGTWAETPGTWADLWRLQPPTIPDRPSASLETVFRGVVNSGCSVRQERDRWLIGLKATGVGVFASRRTTQGPVSDDPAYAGMHWACDYATRVDEIMRRLDSSGAPAIDMATRRWMDSLETALAAYSGDSYPDLLTVLHTTTAHSPDMPLWQEGHETGESTPAVWRVQKPGSPCRIVLTSAGTLEVTHDGVSHPMVPAGLLRVDDTTLGVPDPVSGVTVKGKKVGWDDQDSTWTFEDTQSETTVPDMPSANGGEKKFTVESDAILTDDTNGRWDKGTLTVDRDAWRETVKANAARLRPENLTIDTTDMDDTEYAGLYTTAPIQPLAFIHNRYTKLTDHQGNPATSGGWLTIGGTLSYRTDNGTPEWSNELTVTPIPRARHAPLKWMDLEPVAIPWARMPEMTWAELAQIDQITKETEG